MTNLMHRFARDSKGATAVEYGLIVSLIVVGMIGGLILFGSEAIEMWNNVATTVASS
jgi:pilus assembly protein Flp/PilA